LYVLERITHGYRGIPDFSVPFMMLYRSSAVVHKYLTACRLKELGGGTVLDLGVYTLQFAQLVFGPSLPESVVAQGELNENGVDSSASITLKYRGGKTATLCIHSRVKLPNEAFIVGTRGTIKVSMA
jgi:predicted dehydrogenase